MAKKNLKAALASHTAKKEAKAHQEKIEAAQTRKAESVKHAGRPGKKNQNTPDKKRRKLEEATTEAPASHLNKGKERAALQTTNPFSNDDTVLLVGEGDFSYTRALLSDPFSHAANRILATSFDSERSCLDKYPTAADNIAAIRALAAPEDPIRFNVDAGDLLRDKSIKKWKETSGGFNKIYFGFPHVGQGHKDETRNVLANQLLLLRFFVSAAPLLTQGEKPQYAISNEQGVKKRKSEQLEDQQDENEGDAVSLSDIDPEEDLQSGIGDKRPSASWPPKSPARAGSILITLREAKPYTLWNLPSLATRLTSMLPPVASAAPALPKGLKAPTLADVQVNLPEPSVPIPKPKVKGEPQVKPRQKDRGYDTWRSFRFYPSEWQGYRHVRTIGYDERDKDLLSKDGRNDATEAEAVCRMWEFGLRT